MKRLVHFIGPTLTVALIAGAIYLLYRSLKDIRLVKLWRDLHDVPPASILTAIALTFGSHLALTSYDYIGVRYIKRHLAYWRVALAAFTAYSISHSLGFAAVTGGAVRYRMYSRWGFSAVEVAQIMAMAGVTLFLGMFFIGGVAMLLNGEQVHSWTDGWIHLPALGINVLGVCCLGIVVAYGVVGFFRREPLRLGSFELKIPSPTFAGIQIAVSGLDWLLVASVLYVLLPPNDVFTFWTFLGVFVLAYLLGILSNVPGGLGVFETVVLITLTPKIPTEAVLSSLLVYRAVYHLLPMTLGGLTFLFTELDWSRRGPRRRAAPAYGQARPRPDRRS